MHKCTPGAEPLAALAACCAYGARAPRGTGEATATGNAAGGRLAYARHIAYPADVPAAQWASLRFSKETTK